MFMIKKLWYSHTKIYAFYMILLIFMASYQTLVCGINLPREIRIIFMCEKEISKQFIKIVNQFSNKTAIIYSEQRITYEELNCRANQVALYFIQRLPAKAGSR